VTTEEIAESATKAVIRTLRSYGGGQGILYGTARVMFNGALRHEAAKHPGIFHNPRVWADTHGLRYVNRIVSEFPIKRPKNGWLS
jgi:hypothetical protein